MVDSAVSFDPKADDCDLTLRSEVEGVGATLPPGMGLKTVGVLSDWSEWFRTPHAE